MFGSLGRDGFAVLRGLLRPDEADALAASLANVGCRRSVASCERPNNTLVALRWDDPEVTLMLGDARRVARVRAAASASDLRWTSAYLSSKEARSGPLPWHQDWWCWDHPVTRSMRPAQVALLCYLQPTSIDRGAARVLRATHLRSAALHASLRDGPVFAEQPEQISLEARAGDAVLLDYRLLHGSHPNAGPRRRDCLVLNFTPSWRDLPDDVRAHLVQGFALPSERERSTSRPSWSALLPDHTGPARDLPLVRDAPAVFAHCDGPYGRV